MATLSGCGGSDENKSAVEKRVAQVPHVATGSSQDNIIKPAIILPQPGIYQSALLTHGHTQKLINNIDSLAIVYPLSEYQLRWDVLADDGNFATWWVGRAELLAGSDKPSRLNLTRISRKNDAGNFVMIKGDNGAEFQASPYQMQSNTPGKVLFKSWPVINVDGVATRYAAFDFSSTGISVYNNWSGHVAIMPLQSTMIRTHTWEMKSGLATDMLGDIDVTNNGGKLTVSMPLLSAGCTIVGEGDLDTSELLSKLTFTGFEKCKFTIDNDAGWSQTDYKNTAGLARVKNTAIAYVAEFKDGKSIENLVIGFPELNGVIFKLVNK
ncbi:hypothetical protein K3H47_01505 [Aeromonas veronii]|uniref:hypothetical protein n=1 Tax=Aeromonas veronii TaxID=654 RepID=UPI001F1AA44F|nr:hypothetical protein [Aeromonas veronii]MCF5762635.1 hypothetical protein [Aeromonas veronii]